VTVYNLSINGTSIAMQHAELLPMTRTIDAQCRFSVLVESPGYDESDLTLHPPPTMTGTGTLHGFDSRKCRSTYDLRPAA
jgi:hypothetical protein